MIHGLYYDDVGLQRYKIPIRPSLFFFCEMPAGKAYAPVHPAEKDKMAMGDRHQMYEMTRDHVRVDRGTPYPCTQKDLDGYMKHHRHNLNARYVTTVKATNELCNWLNHFHEPDASSMAALERLKNGLQLRPWGPDLVIKAFKDLDIAFFKGTLLGNVRVRWKGYEECDKLLSAECLLGITLLEGHAQCRIILNSYAILVLRRDGRTSFQEMWRVILHEMCVSRPNIPDSRLQSLRDPWRSFHRHCKARRSQLTYENLPS